MDSRLSSAMEAAVAWARHADRALAYASSKVRIIAASTPKNFRAELTRLAARWAAGEARVPRFEYAPPADLCDIARALDDLAEHLEREGPIGALYAGRARELHDEARACLLVGTGQFRAAALERYARRDRFDDAADELAERWLAEPAPADEGADHVVISDDERDPRSLLRRTRQEVSRRRLPLRVVVSPDLASLAATGEGGIHVVAGRRLGVRDVERTVLHEIEGHVMPRQRANGSRLGLFVVGTAGGSDDQEGRAIALEEGAGYLDHKRRRELALRHVAARAVQLGAAFVDTARRLEAYGAPPADLVRIAARAHRGGGLAREAVYLPAFLRFTAARARDARVEAVLARAKVSVDSVDTLLAAGVVDAG